MKDIIRMTAVFLAFVMLSNGIVAQQKEVSKSMALYKKGKLESAIKVLHAAANKYNDDELWDMLVQMEMEKCEQSANDMSVMVGLIVMDLLDQTIDSLTETTPTAMDPGVRRNMVIYQDCLLACNEALLKSTSKTASMLERILSVDTYPDSTVSDEARASYGKAEEYFSKSEYLPAKNMYLKALSQHPGYYKAALYAGDMYWHLEELDSAIHYLTLCTKWQPHLLEPRVYMIDALAAKGEDKKAIDECMYALTVYPNEHIFDKLQQLLDRNGMEMQRTRLQRGAVINKNFTYASDKDIKFIKPSAIWTDYSNAHGTAGFNKYGIALSPSGDALNDYLELQSWKKMMEANPDAPELSTARKMQEAGYLDCYIMVTQFHRGFYEQYIHFMSANRNRVLDFCRKHLVKV